MLGNLHDLPRRGALAPPPRGAAPLPVSWLARRGSTLEEGSNRLVPGPAGGAIPDLSDLTGRVHKLPWWGSSSDASKVRKLREMAKEYGADPRMRFFTVNAILRPAGVTDFRDYPRVAAALLAWVQANIYYTNESNEQIQSPWWTLKVRTGDCDDCALMLATLAESVRLPWRYRLGGHAPTSKAELDAWTAAHAASCAGGQQPLVRRGRLMVYPCGHAPPRTRVHRWAEGQRFPKGFRAFHIYNDLGWPPFSEGKLDGFGRPLTTWAAAEPSMRLPLGHDYLLHGPAGGSGGGMPEGGRLHGLEGYGFIPGYGWGELGLAELAPGEQAVVVDQRGDPKGIVQVGPIRLNWADIAVSTAQSIVVALIVGYLSRGKA